MLPRILAMCKAMILLVLVVVVSQVWAPFASNSNDRCVMKPFTLIQIWNPIGTMS